LVLGTSFIFGNYGPTMLPMVFHRAMYSGLMTPSLITTLVLALHMHEEARGVQNYERRHVFVHYRCTIAAFATIFFVWGEGGFILMIMIMDFRPGYLAFFFLVCGSITQFGLAIFFISRSNLLSKSVSNYMVYPGHSDVRANGRTKLQRLRYWGFAASGAMMVNSTTRLLNLFTVAVASTSSTQGYWKFKSPLFYFLVHLTLAMSRTAVSFAQISALIQNNGQSQFVSLKGFWVLSASIRARSTSSPTLPEENTESISALSDERRLDGQLSSTELGEIQTRARALARMLHEERSGL